MERYTFAKSSRLLKPAEFQKVRREGGRLSTRRFNIYVLPNGLAHHRLGLSVSRRVGNAVVRNRVKRLLREYFRLRGRVGNVGRPGDAGRQEPATVPGRTERPTATGGGKTTPLFDLIGLPSDVLVVARSAEGINCLRDVAADLATVRPARPGGGGGERSRGPGSRGARGSGGGEGSSGG